MSCFDPDGDGQSGDRNGDGAADVADCNAPEPITCAANLVLEWDGRAWVCNPEANVSSGDYAVFFDDFYRLSPFWSGDATLALSPQGGIELFATDESPADSNITVPIPSGADLFSLTANAYLEVRLARLPAGAATYGIGFVDGNALVGGLSKTLSGWEVSCREGGVQTGVGHSVAVSLVAPELIELEIDTSGAPALVVRVDEVEVARLTDCGASFAPAAIGFVKAPYGPEPQSISAIVDYVKWKAPREPAPMRGVGGVTGPVGGNGGNGGAGGNGP